MVETGATHHRELQPGKEGRHHLFVSLTVTRSKASGTLVLVVILRTVAPAAMPLGVQ